MNISASEMSFGSPAVPVVNVTEPAESQAPVASSPPLPPARDARNLDIEDSLNALPPYARSLLRIKVPAIVTLASTRQPLQRLLQLGPGSIIQFNKPSDAPLTVEISNTTVALGEAVKVGDKYGVWITSMVLPDERFVPLTPLPKS